jgi:hypothetical protein
MDNQFESIINIIREGFQPENVTNEQQAEKELLQFLNARFPNMIKGQGHTSTGVRIDIVIEGTYAIELVTVDNESRLVTLMHQMVQSKEDFSHLAVVLVDLGKIPFDKIQNYVDEYEKLNVKTVVKKAYVGKNVLP